MAHGQGFYMHYNGPMFTGKWFEDKQHGLGQEVWPDGTSYDGRY
jgi:hypothetical protein